jgi:hypothetical protein
MQPGSVVGPVRNDDDAASLISAIAVNNFNKKGENIMKTSLKTIGVVVIISFVFFGLPAFSDEKAIGDAETVYTCAIDKEIAKCQAKIERKNSRSVNLQREAAKASMKSAFLKDYKKELIAAMKREDIGTKDYQINKFLNEKFFEVFTPILAGGQHYAVPLMASGK